MSDWTFLLGIKGALYLEILFISLYEYGSCLSICLFFRPFVCHIFCPSHFLKILLSHLNLHKTSQNLQQMSSLGSLVNL